MTSSNDRVIPTIDEFLKSGFTQVSLADCKSEECHICASPYEPDDNIVTLDPCGHDFHRLCIVTWFKSQTFEIESEDDEVHGTCPFDRIKLFHFTITDVEEDTDRFRAIFWAESLHQLKSTQFEEMGQHALARINASDEVTFELAQEIVNDIIEQNSEYEEIAKEHGMRRRSLVVQLPARVATERHEVDVLAEEDRQFVNATIRGDVSSLEVIASQHLGNAIDNPESDAHSINFIDMIRPILNDWMESNYPRTNYITMDPLHELVVAALLIAEVSDMDHYDNTQGFAQLLAHGEALLLQAQERVTGGSLSENELFEHWRVLDWVPLAAPEHQAGYSMRFLSQETLDMEFPFANTQSNLMWHPANFMRVQWIVWLRQRTRGRDADPLGS
ncbi:hypothetical protein GRF29_44g756040 [Pseudopithomyces chartarum]|uniref:RING-type domain-containing protein n=1 Tax=Pseudopithomyces chartarum TaxID=1892770 RepID=A0AAN6LZ22_9PLEO|nr:hypothetical protein GRF29_44g756040 [Pseudopithomyces chartarum]